MSFLEENTRLKEKKILGRRHKVEVEEKGLDFYEKLLGEKVLDN